MSSVLKSSARQRDVGGVGSLGLSIAAILMLTQACAKSELGWNDGWTPTPAPSQASTAEPVNSVIPSVTARTFDTKVVADKRLVLVDFWAPWCGPCQKLAPELEATAKALGDKVGFYKVNVDDAPTLSDRFGIDSIPTMLLFKNGKLLGEYLGRRDRESLTAYLKSRQ